jgi:hypothetical protein
VIYVLLSFFMLKGQLISVKDAAEAAATAQVSTQ